MKLQERKYPSDGYAWRWCAVISVRKGSFFEKVHISLSNYILIIYAWAQNNRIKDTAVNTGLYLLCKFVVFILIINI